MSKKHTVHSVTFIIHAINIEPQEDSECILLTNQCHAFMRNVMKKQQEEEYIYWTIPRTLFEMTLKEEFVSGLGPSDTNST